MKRILTITDHTIGCDEHGLEIDTPYELHNAPEGMYITIGDNDIPLEVVIDTGADISIETLW